MLTLSLQCQLASAACSAFNRTLHLLELQQVFCSESWAMMLEVFKHWVVVTAQLSYCSPTGAASASVLLIALSLIALQCNPSKIL